MNKENKLNSKGGLTDLIKYMKKHAIYLVLALLFAIGGSIITVYGPEKLSEITDLITQGIMTGIDMDKIYEVGIFMAILYAISIVLSYLQSFIMATITQTTTKKLRSDITEKINKLSLKYYDKTTVGDTLSRVTNDVDTIGQTLNQSMVALVSGVSLFLGSLFMMVKTNVILSITAIVATVIGFILMILIVSKSQKFFQRQQNLLGKINGHIEEVYTGHSVIKVYNAQEKVNNEFKVINDELRDSAWKSQFISGLMMPLMSFIGNFGYVAVCVVGAILTFKKVNNEFKVINDELRDSAWKSQFISGLMMPLMSFIGNFGYVAVCVVGAILTFNDKISFGVIVAFMMYIRFFTQPLAQFAQAATSLQSTSAACKRVFEFLKEEMEEESHKNVSLEKIEGHVNFENVKFGYDEDKLIIKDFSANIKAGQKVAIVGPTGAGKTTLVNLLMKFYDVSSGSIKIDNVPISNLSREKVHDLFCMVLQDTWLFEGTIRDNIAYNKENVSQSIIVAAVRQWV